MYGQDMTYLCYGGRSYGQSPKFFKSSHFAGFLLFCVRLNFYSHELIMNKFIGGSYDGLDFPMEGFDSNVFYAGNIDTNLQEEYIKIKAEKNGLNYIFWVLKDIDESIVQNKIGLFLENV